MRQLFAAALLVVGACGSNLAEMTTEDRASVMAAALDHLVSKEFSANSYPLYLVEDQTISLGAFVAVPEGIDRPPSSRPIAQCEKSAIEEALARYGEVRWISDPSDWFTEMGSIANGAAIVAVGEPIADAPGFPVGVSLLCGNVCGLGVDISGRAGSRRLAGGTKGPSLCPEPRLGRLP